MGYAAFASDTRPDGGNIFAARCRRRATPLGCYFAAMPLCRRFSSFILRRCDIAVIFPRRHASCQLPDAISRHDAAAPPAADRQPDRFSLPVFRRFRPPSFRQVTPPDIGCASEAAEAAVG
jgi:hypothetical protein